MAKKKKRKNQARDVPYIAAGEAWDKYSSYPSEGLTPERLARILKRADQGDVREQMELYEDIEEKDPHLYSQMQTRKLAVTGLDWEVQPFSSDERDKQISEWVNEQMLGIEGLNEILMDMLDAIGKGISVMEIMWGVDTSMANVIEDIRYVHPKKLTWDTQTDEMRICTQDCPSGIHMPENKFVVHRYKAKSGHESRAGVLRVVVWMYMFKNFSIKDWVAFCEVYGMPVRIGKYDSSASKDDRQALYEAIRSIGSDAAGIVPTSTMIEFIETNKNSSTDAYDRLVRYCDEQVSKAVLGQTLSSDSGGGSYAQGKVHNEVRHDLTKADANALAQTIRRQVIGPLVEYNFGADADLPIFNLICEDPEDLLQTAEIYAKLGTELGLPISEDHVYKKFNIPKPEEGQRVLKPQKFRMDAQTAGMQDVGEATAAMKDGAAEWQGEQETEGQGQADLMAELARKNYREIYTRVFAPLKALAGSCSTLEELREVLEDGEQAAAVYKQMDGRALEDLLYQGMYLAELIGRAEP